MVSQRAVQALVVVIKLDVFEDFTPGLGAAAEDLVVWKTLCFQRAEETDLSAQVAFESSSYIS